MSYAKYILQVKDLSLDFGSEATKTLHDISFDLRKGEILGLIGNSGCGKTMTALSVSRLLPKDARLTSGSIVFDGKELMDYKEKDMRKLRGKEIAMIFQEPYTALDPLKTVFKNLEEVLTEHEDLTKDERRARILNMLKRVGFNEAEDILGRYPHELSGGQRQKAAIAMCLVQEPSVIIADEPFSALDASSQASIIKLLSDINTKNGTTMLIVSHNLRVIKAMCSKVIVMDKGKIVEAGDPDTVLNDPKSDTTAALLKARMYEA